MLIGAIIGFALSMTISAIAVAIAQSQVNEHNNSRLLVAARGRAKLTINYGVIIIRTAMFTSIGAIIGYFC